ncbi:hypothetical protein [Vibrio fluvialis]|uniref:hypothetical protein n=1 Tax=Vibrio fluvialis TaxID=676 RepID=UPI0025730E96|nr:hypothetical protein [Vibrio fluvialis]BEI26577.1 hypothetical protein KKIDH5335_49090 [Vibrio fluvialis]
MNSYLVKVFITEGKCDRTSHRIIKSDSFGLAAQYGIYVESQYPGKLDWSENRVIDFGGEVSYQTSVQKLNREDGDVMSKYFPVLTASLSDLLESGNYREHCYVEPVTQPRTLWECSLAQATKYLVSIQSGNAYAEYLYIKNSDCIEVPNGINLCKENKASFLINSREVLLHEIETVALVIESAMKRGFELCDTELKQQSAMVSQPMSEIFHQAILREQGLKYPDDMPFDS